MNTKLDNRTMLVRLVESLDVSDLKQILAYAAGYEAGKMEPPADLAKKTQT